VLADAVLNQLRIEAQQQTQQQDDDLPNAPDPMASAQSRRAAVLGVSL